MIMLRQSRWFLLVLILVLPSLACNLGSSKKADLPQPPSGQIIPNADASDRVEQNFYQAIQEASGNRTFRFRITNEEITSVVALALQERADIPLADPQIWFTAGKVYMTGTVEGIGPAALPALIVGIPQINANGQLEIKFDEAKMGSFDFPEATINNLTQTTNETLVDLQLDIQITAIEVLEGELLLAGKRTDQ